MLVEVERITGSPDAVAQVEVRTPVGRVAVGWCGDPVATLGTHYVEWELDAAADYQASDFAEQLAHAVPDGIDTAYENVGAALLPHLNPNAQVDVGGVMSQITRTGAFGGPDHLPDLLGRPSTRPSPFAAST